MFKRISFQTPFNPSGEFTDAIAVYDESTGIYWYVVGNSTYCNATFEDVVSLGATEVVDLDCFSVCKGPVTFEMIEQHIKELNEEGY